VLDGPRTQENWGKKNVLLGMSIAEKERRKGKLPQRQHGKSLEEDVKRRDTMLIRGRGGKEGKG